MDFNLKGLKGQLEFSGAFILAEILENLSL